MGAVTSALAAAAVAHGAQIVTGADVVAVTPDGEVSYRQGDAEPRPCVEAKTTADLEAGLGLTGGNIFHGALAWPFADDDDPLDTPARQWGVATGHDRILLCGSGARRGGAVSGLGGHNAAQAVLAQR